MYNIIASTHVILHDFGLNHDYSADHDDTEDIIHVLDVYRPHYNCHSYGDPLCYLINTTPLYCIKIIILPPPDSRLLKCKARSVTPCLIPDSVLVVSSLHLKSWLAVDFDDLRSRAWMLDLHLRQCHLDGCDGQRVSEQQANNRVAGSTLDSLQPVLAEREWSRKSHRSVQVVDYKLQVTGNE